MLCYHVEVSLVYFRYMKFIVATIIKQNIKINIKSKINIYLWDRVGYKNGETRRR